MLLRFWGTRGSIAAPGPATARYGGNTSCVEVVTRAGQRFIFDCGTGARALGNHLLAHEPKPLTATILLSHTHWDHIQGFPFFAPVFEAGNRIVVCAPQGANRTLPEVLAGQMEYTYFPVELSQLGASIEYHDLSEGVHDLGGVRVTTQFLNHPAMTLGYRIEADGASVLYLCDHEPYWERLWRSDAEPGRLESILHDGDRRHAAFMENADVVVHDAQYTPEQYASKKNWGHSTFSYATQIAAAANVRRLFLTHHDPAHDDDFVDRIEERARELAATLHSPLQVFCAREGHAETIVNSAAGATLIAGLPASETASNRPLRIVIADDHEDLRVMVRRALVKSGHEVFEAAGGTEALALIQREKPDLVLLDLMMPPPGGLAVLESLRSRAETHSLPVIVLTGEGDEESARICFELGATDFLGKPFSLPQLDARIRSSFARTAQPERPPG